MSVRVSSFLGIVSSEGRKVSHRLVTHKQKETSVESSRRKGAVEEAELTLSSMKNNANPPKIAQPTKTFLFGSTTTILTSPEG